MTNEQNEIIYDGQNRCKRCDRPLKDPLANYGWWCAKLVGANCDKEVESILDGDALKLYNTYRSTYLVEDDKPVANTSGKFEKVTWINSAKEGIEWASEKLKSAFNQYKNALTWVWGEANEIQKSLQRKFWQIGAQEYLREGKGYLTSAWMLEHSLHTNTIYLNGYKREDGKWIVNARMNDIYDFTRITSFMGDEKYEWSKEIGLGTVANDVAVVSQLTGAIQPYYVAVDFWTTR